MRYRMEVLNNYELAICNVEADIKLGSALLFWAYHPDDPARPIFACNVLSKDGDSIAKISTLTVPNPIEMATVAIACHEKHVGYTGFREVAENPDPQRMEWRLGTLLADAVPVIAGALLECWGDKLKAETRDKCGELLQQIYDVWYASLFGSFDAERRVHEPYFANSPASGPRMAFAAAAQHYGMYELRRRFPEASEAMLREGLSWPLVLLDLFNRLSPPVTWH